LAVSDLSMALHQLSRALSIHPHVDVGYVAAMAGLVLLLTFAGIGTALALVRLARRVWNATPRGLLTALLVGAWVLILIGILVP